MTTFKNIALFGASGDLGAPVLKELVDSGKFNVTIFTRKESSSTFSTDIKVVTVDYSSISELTTALKGQDVVISTLGSAGILGQKELFDAAIAANVSRFLPSEFGTDLTNPKTHALPVLSYKHEIRRYVEEKVAAGAQITYTYVVNSAFLDWGLEKSFLINWQGGEPVLYDDGDTPFSSALLSDVGRAVVGVLTHPNETTNRQVTVSSVVTTQNKLLALAKKADPERATQWKPVFVKISDVENSVTEAIAKGDFSLPVIYDQLKMVTFGGAPYGQPLKNDNELLGVGGALSDDELVAVWKKTLA